MAISRHNANTGSASSTTTVSATLAVNSGEIIVVYVNQESVSGAVKTVTGISDTVNSYAQRFSASASGASEPAFGASEGTEVWWALATTTTTLTITATLSGTFDDAVIVLAGYQGFTGTAYQTNPWDSNASLPKTNQAATRGDATASGISTTSTAGILLAAESSCDNGILPSPPTGFSLAGQLLNGGATNAVQGNLWDEVYSSAQSSITVTTTGIQNLGWIFYVDALTDQGSAAAQPSGSGGYYSVKAITQGVINGAQPHLLAYESYPPRGNVPSPVVPYGKADYYDSRPFSWTLRGARPQWQQHDAYAMRFVQQNPPPGSGGFTWFYDRAVYPSLRFRDQHESYPARGNVPSPVTPVGWTAPYDSRPWASWRHPRPELLTYDAETPQSFAFVAVPQGAPAFFDFDKYPALQFRHQHEGYPARGNVPTAATPQGWTAFYDAEVVPRTKAALADHEAAEFTFFPPRPLWTDYYDAEVIKGRARDYSDGPTPATQAAATTFIWTDYYDMARARSARQPAPAVDTQRPAVVFVEFGAYYDRARLRPFLTQQHDPYPALGLVPTAATPQGFTAPFDLARVLGFPAKLQQHDGYQHFIPPVAVNLGPLGWSMYWDRGKRPLSADRVPFLFEQLYQTPTAATPQGWTHLLDTARVRGFPAHLQQHDGLGRLSFPAPFVTVTFERLDVAVIRPRAFPYSVADTPPFRVPQGWEPSYAVAVRKPFRFPDHAPTPILQPVATVPPSAYVLFPELFRRPRAVPYLTWPEQRVAVLNTPAGPGGPTYFYDRRLAVMHRPVAEVVPFDGRGLPFVVVNLIIHHPGKSGLLTPQVLVATNYQPTLAGIKATPDLSGEVED